MELLPAIIQSQPPHNRSATVRGGRTGLGLTFLLLAGRHKDGASFANSILVHLGLAVSPLGGWRRGRGVKDDIFIRWTFFWICLDIRNTTGVCTKQISPQNIFRKIKPKILMMAMPHIHANGVEPVSRNAAVSRRSVEVEYIDISKHEPSLSFRVDLKIKIKLHAYMVHTINF